MKKLVILTAAYGEGHNTAARSLTEAVQAFPGVKVRICDLLDETFGPVNDLVRKVYITAVNRVPVVWERLYRMIDSGAGVNDSLPLLAPVRQKLRELLESERPHVVVSTYPLYNPFLQTVQGEFGFRRVTVVTDSITVNSIWYRYGSDRFIVPNEETAAVMKANGVPEELLCVLGFPVSPRFANRPERKEPPAPGEPWKILYIINSGKQAAPGIVRALLGLPEIELEVATGRDEALRQTVEAVVAESGRNAIVKGWTDRMPERMMAAHLLISKAGGATVQEALAALTPMIITEVLPGQEEGNARLLLENRGGAQVGTPEEIAAAVGNAIANGGAQWHEWQGNLQRLSRPAAAHAAAECLLSLTP